MRRTGDRSGWGDKATGLTGTPTKPHIGDKCHWINPLMTWGEVGDGTKKPFPLVRCQTMNDRLEETNSHKKGLMMSIMMHKDTGQERVLGIVHHRDSRGRGMLLNFCPWCGGNIAARPRAEGN